MLSKSMLILLLIGCLSIVSATRNNFFWTIKHRTTTTTRRSLVTTTTTPTPTETTPQNTPITGPTTTLQPVQGQIPSDWPWAAKLAVCSDWCQGSYKSPTTGFNFVINEWERCGCEITQRSGFWQQTDCFSDCVNQCLLTDGGCAINVEGNPYHKGICCSDPSNTEILSLCYQREPSNGLCFCDDPSCIVDHIFPNLTFHTTTTTTTPGGVTISGGFGKK